MKRSAAQKLPSTYRSGDEAKSNPDRTLQIVGGSLIAASQGMLLFGSRRGQASNKLASS